MEEKLFLSRTGIEPDPPRSPPPIYCIEPPMILTTSWPDQRINDVSVAWSPARCPYGHLLWYTLLWGSACGRWLQDVDQERACKERTMLHGLTDRSVPSGTVYRYRVVASDDAGHASEPSRPCWLRIYRTFPAGTVARAYQHGFSEEAGPPRDIWTLVEGQLPPGLELLTLRRDFDGEIKGTPRQGGKYSFVMRAPSGYYRAATIAIM